MKGCFEESPIIKGISSSKIGKFPCPNQVEEGEEDPMGDSSGAPTSLWQRDLPESRASPAHHKGGPP